MDHFKDKFWGVLALGFFLSAEAAVGGVKEALPGKLDVGAEASPSPSPAPCDPSTDPNLCATTHWWGTNGPASSCFELSPAECEECPTDPWCLGGCIIDTCPDADGDGNFDQVIYDPPSSAPGVPPAGCTRMGRNYDMPPTAPCECGDLACQCDHGSSSACYNLCWHSSPNIS